MLILKGRPIIGISTFIYIVGCNKNIMNLKFGIPNINTETITHLCVEKGTKEIKGHKGNKFSSRNIF